MLSTVLYYELAMKVPISVGITVYLLTWGLGHLRCLVMICFYDRLNLFLALIRLRLAQVDIELIDMSTLW